MYARESPKSGALPSAKAAPLVKLFHEGIASLSFQDASLPDSERDRFKRRTIVEFQYFIWRSRSSKEGTERAPQKSAMTPGWGWQRLTKDEDLCIPEAGLKLFEQADEMVPQ